jgi:3-hydroxyacyl-[acyl-carrier-protein] dehydratase
MAQTGGILLAEKLNFESLIVMAKIPKVVFHGWALPGDTLTYDAKLLDAREDGGIVECIARIGDRVLAEAEYVFACLPDSRSKTSCQENFLKTMQLLGAGDSLTAAPDSGSST